MINSRSKSKDFSVYDFSAEQLEVESFSTTNMSKLKARLEYKENTVENPKYELMQNCNSSPEASCRDTPGKRVAIFEKSTYNENMASSTSYAECAGMCLDKFGTEMLVREDPITKPVSDIQSNGTPVDVNSKDAENSTPSPVSKSASASDIADHEDEVEHHFADTCFTTHGEKEVDGLSVTIFPDYIIYENNLYGEAQLVFSSDYILVKCSDTSGDIVVECAVTDIVYIESQWSESVRATLVKLHFRENAVSKEKVHETHDFTELIFSASDMSWLDKEQKIKCLAEKYEVAWNTPHYGNYELEAACVAHKSFFPGYYFTGIPYSFEDVVYPKGDPDAVSISSRDIELLEPDTFVNDTIIDFYIKYLKTKIPVNERQRYHFFNSFFFRKLADLDKDPDSASEGRAAFLRVRKWTRKINIFEKDYIFIPVNFNLHWSLLIICHPGEVGTLKDDDVKDSQKIPCILHMDSIKGNHSGLKDLIQSYLLEEWKERHPEPTEDYTFGFSNLRFVSLELPQQENAFDCGLFLLHYVELFMEEAPLNFNPLRISKSSSFLTADWFVPSEASFKRSLIRKLIYDLLNDNLQNNTSEPRLNDTNIRKNPVFEFYNGQCTQSKTTLNNPDSSITVKGIEMNIETSSTSCIEYNKKEELSTCEVKEPGTNQAGIFKEDMSFQLLECSTEEVNNDNLEQHVASNPNEDNRQAPGDVSKSPTSPTTNSAKEIEEVDIQPNSMQEKEEGDLVISPKASDNPMIPNENDDSTHLPDTPISSSGENQGIYREENEDETPPTGNGGNEKPNYIEISTASDEGDENTARTENKKDDDNIEKEKSCEDSQGTVVIITGVKGDDVNAGGSKDVTDVDEKSVSGGTGKKREGSNAKKDTSSRKKRKVSPPEGARRITRSFYKGRRARK